MQEREPELPPEVKGAVSKCEPPFPEDRENHRRAQTVDDWALSQEIRSLASDQWLLDIRLDRLRPAGIIHAALAGTAGRHQQARCALCIDLLVRTSRG